MGAGEGSPAARWRILPADLEARTSLAAALGVSPLAAQVLINRDLGDPSAARAFLDVRLEQLSVPRDLPQMDRVVDRLVRAGGEQEQVVVYGDYDADGVTATAQIVRVLRRAGARVQFYIPDRQAEGYGLHAAAVEALAARGARLLVAVDCGTTATDAARAARGAGLDLIILDHHEPVGHLPDVWAIVNPKLGGPSVPGSSTDYCAAGLAYQACRGVLAAIGQDGDDPDLVALAALGTVADTVDLLHDNRIIVACGLEAFVRSTVPGLAALREVAAVQPPLRVRDLSHALAPRLNAAGRLARADSAVRLLTSDDQGECRRIAADLDRLNQERRALCDQALAQAVEEIETSRLHEGPAIVLAREGWHPGVVGIVASQIVERYYRPTVLVAVRDGLGKGSARSIPALHMVAALAAASGSLMAYGGHAMAAGLTVAAEAIEQFRAAFIEAVGARLQAGDLRPETRVDAEADLEDLTASFAAEIERLAPFGAGNPEPLFVTRGLHAVGTRLVGGGAHLRLLISDGTRTAEAIAFRLGDRAELLAFTQARVDLAYTVESSRWRDAAPVQLVVADLDTPGVDLGRIATDTGAVLARLFERADDYLGGRLVGVEQAPAFHTKVVGVTFEGRQALLPEVRPGERLRLVRDPGNPRDPHAIKVCLADGRQVGFLRAALAARLAPAIDAGVRYVATATALTGGGDRAWGLNLYVERDTSWTGEAAEPAAAGTRWPAGPGFADRLAAQLYRGRPLSAAQREVVDRLLAGELVVARFGPGRGLVASVAMATAALIARGEGPIVAVLPRAGDADAWGALMGPWLRDIGLRAGILHGALPPEKAAWSSAAWERGEIDLLLTSAAWMERRAPDAGAVIAAVDALPSDDALADVFRRCPDRVRLITGPASEQQLLDAARSLGREWTPGRAIADPALRGNLRVVDRRGRPKAEVAPPDNDARPGRTLIITADARTSVAVARSLRERYPGAADQIAYYHQDLPAALRRVLEDLFGAGRITALVAGTPVVDPSIPADVTRVVAVGLPPDRLLAADALGTGGLGGQTAVVELGYGAESLDTTQASLEARFPSRETLAQCYHRLWERFRDGWWTWSDGLPAGLEDAALPAAAVPECIEVFVEAGVLTREGGEGGDTRYSLIGPGERVDLERSLRYREGVRARAAWSDLRAWATGPASAILADLARS